MQARLEAMGTDAALPLALMYIAKVALAHGKPLLASEGAKSPAATDGHGPSITDEGIGEFETEAVDR